MAIVASGWAGVHTGTTVNITLRDQTTRGARTPAVGNSLIAFCSSATNDDSAVDPPDITWEEIPTGPSSAASNTACTVLRHTVEEGDGSAYAFTLALAATDDITVVLIEDDEVGTAFDVAAITGGVNSTTVTVPAAGTLTPGFADEIWYYACGTSNASQDLTSLSDSFATFTIVNDATTDRTTEIDAVIGGIVVAKKVVEGGIAGQACTVVFDASARMSPVLVGFEKVAVGGATDLVIADASHAHTSDNAALTQVHSLTVADALHAHTADNVVLSAAGDLVIGDALHAHAADNLVLAQVHSLAIADAIHAHSSDNVVLDVPVPWQTEVTISGTNFLINGTVTHQGQRAEGSFLNLRCANAIFDNENGALDRFDYPSGPAEAFDPQRNTDEFCAFLPDLAAAGATMFTISLQGGNPGGTNGQNVTSAFNADGSLKAAWKARAEQVIETADAEGMVVILTCYYHAQEQILTDNAAVQVGVENVVDWIYGDKGYLNVLLEIANEHNVGGFDHSSLADEDEVGALCVHARSYALSEHGKTIYTSVSKSNATINGLLEYTSYGTPHLNVYSEADNGAEAATALDNLLGSAQLAADPQPLVVNEDSLDLEGKAEVTLERGIGWGYHHSGTNDYVTGFQWPPINWDFDATADKQDLRAWFEEESGQADTLAIADASHTHTAESPSLTQTHALSVADSSHAHSAGSLALAQVHELQIGDSEHSHTAENVALAAQGSLGIADAHHGHTADSLTLTVDAVNLTIADSSHAHTAESLTLAVIHHLSVQDALHAHAADDVALTQLHLLSIADALHGHASDNVVFQIWAATPRRVAILTPQGEGIVTPRRETVGTPRRG